MSIIKSNLFEEVLLKPIRNGANELLIVSGYATATMATRHIEVVRRELKTNISINLIVGMCPRDGLQKSQHLNFQKLAKGEFEADFKCNYITDNPPVHSKVYTWLKDGIPLEGYLGSANYTQSAFSNSMREVLTEKDGNDCNNYFQSLIGKSINCLSENVSDLINLYENRNPFEFNKSEFSAIDGSINQKITLSLLQKSNGEVPLRSGLNWGQRPEYNRDPNQAYINIPAEIGRSGFFPERYEQFMVLTEDGKEIICVRAQSDGKGIQSTLNNADLGLYFRYKIGLPDGAFITKNDLLKYGRTDVDFIKLDDETYFMDFSV